MEQETTKPSFLSRVKEYFAAKRVFSARNIAYLGILLALVVVLQVFASSIPVGGTTSLNFSLVPIVLGAILLGPVGGLILGFACGLVVLIQVILMTSGIYSVMWAEAPVMTALICLLKTSAAGFVAGLVYHLLEKKQKFVAVFVASALVPIVNTGLFILGCLCLTKIITEATGAQNILVFILVTLVTFNFFIEFGINLVLSPAIHRVVIVVEKQIRGKMHKNIPAQSEAEGAAAENTIEENTIVEEGKDIPQTDNTTL